MKFILPILCFAIFGFHLDAFACTTILAGKKATVDGSVLNSHTGDGASYRTDQVGFA